jgi:hypothetical protein
MRKLILLSCSLAAFCTLPVTAIVVGAAEDSDKPAFRDDKTGLEFADIEGFQRTDVHRYKQAGLGYSVDYFSDAGIRVTVYVYDFELPAIPDGPDSELVKTNIEQAKGDIFRAKEQGLYQAVEQLSDCVITLDPEAGGAKVRKMSFKVRRDDKDNLSTLYLTGYKNHFVKVRITYAADNKQKCEQEIAKVTARLASMLKTTPPEEKPGS